MNHRSTASIVLRQVARGLVLLLWCHAGVVSAQGSEAVVVAYEGRLINSGKWGLVAQLQSALSKALAECGKPGVAADGLLGNDTRSGLRRLAACEGFSGFGIGRGQVSDGRVTVELWQALVGEQAPDVLERSFTIWLSHEDTDYDRVEFNFTSGDDPSPHPVDPYSYLTWGPYGATVGHGGEIQQILTAPVVRVQLRACFGEREMPKVEALLPLRKGDAGQLIQEIVRDATRRELWRGAFDCLGESEIVRQAYDQAAFGTGSTWVLSQMRKLYTLIPDSSEQATDIDFAFFVDIAMHASVGQERVEGIRAALQEEERQIGRALTAPERRRAIGNEFVRRINNDRQRRTRLGRNVTFYVDALSLSEEERAAWSGYKGLKASQLGLTDAPFWPLSEP